MREYVLTIPEIEDFRVYVEQEEPKEKIVVVPVMEGKVSSTFATAPEFAVYRIRNKNAEHIETFENPALKKKVRRGLAAAKAVLEKNPYAVIVKNIGEISYNTLKEGLVRIYRAEGDDVMENLKKLEEGDLEELHAATVKKE